MSRLVFALFTAAAALRPPPRPPPPARAARGPADNLHDAADGAVDDAATRADDAATRTENPKAGATPLAGAFSFLRSYKFGDITQSAVRAAGQKDYKFGDLTKSAVRASGRSDYEFGDASKWLDGQAKAAVNNITQKESYEFGDVTRWADLQAKAKVTTLTGKEAYQFGDISKALVHIARTREYSLDDVFFLVKAGIVLGSSLAPVGALLPVKFLIDLLNMSLMGDMTDRVAAFAAGEVDKRCKEAVTGDANYKVGDLTMRAILKFTGKEKYEFGDVARTVKKLGDEAEASKKGALPKPRLLGVPGAGESELDAGLAAELEAWDEAVLGFVDETVWGSVDEAVAKATATSAAKATATLSAATATPSAATLSNAKATDDGHRRTSTTRWKGLVCAPKAYRSGVGARGGLFEEAFSAYGGPLPPAVFSDRPRPNALRVPPKRAPRFSKRGRRRAPRREGGDDSAK
eukprot:CAMPEP_0184230610 /NCGR_PEP_ID=MMETSP0976-20121227/22858_1 /TAXON_ID=483370 /ORGANISM="non described non described, Strain CCMP2097" /LENGTH=462 /DNA_ID=CAMNT_0026535599 /DNA_START=73 /DNA_END=1459 /DNA_ORIENTATION=-